MERKQMQVYAPVKEFVQEMKNDLEFSNESEVIVYLYALYKNRYKQMLHTEHKQAMEFVKEVLNTK